VVALAGLLVLSACDMPPMDSTQQGFRGTGMVEIDNPEDIEAIAAANQAPEPLPLAMATPGLKAADVYENVQVLGDLTVAEFISQMSALVQWVAPEEGCTYCHAANNLAADDKYTKVVARRMLQMTKQINAEWKSHVADTGVTCYTCHRGKPVPAYYWYEGHELPDTKGLAASRMGQNLASPSVGYSSLPYEPFSALIYAANGEVNVASDTALPVQPMRSMGATETTYALMMHMSESLGVNCTYCHNSQAFSQWGLSNPARATAWHGIRMARDINREYMTPLQPVYPANRLGPTGDAPKLNCSTCHQGVAKPLYGVSMVGQYPALSAMFDDSSSLHDSMLAFINSDDHAPAPTSTVPAALPNDPNMTVAK
jgi:photosynthetic reaction center cytochrome c subunit